MYIIPIKHNVAVKKTYNCKKKMRVSVHILREIFPYDNAESEEGFGSLHICGVK